MTKQSASHSAASRQVLRPTIPPLPSFPYVPKFDTFTFGAHTLRYAFIDERGEALWDTWSGKSADAKQIVGNDVASETILCLHGEPSWGYLYRKMIPGFLHAAPAPRAKDPSKARYVTRRILVPDFIGFGRSDKPLDDVFYTWEMHRAWLLQFVEKHVASTAISPSSRQRARVTLVVQDWGGLLGLILPMRNPSLFTNLIVMNTGLGIGVPPTRGWLKFHDFMAKYPDVDIGALFKRGTPLTAEEQAAYALPFQNNHYVNTSDGSVSSHVALEIEAKAGVRRFPQLVPIKPDQEGVAESCAAMNYFANLTPRLVSDSEPQRSQTERGKYRDALQVFVCIGESDPVLGTAIMDELSSRTWGQRSGYWRTTIPEAGHFVQEWAEHIPRLADLAWATRIEQGPLRLQANDREGKPRSWVADWRAPSRKAEDDPKANL